MQVIPSSWYVIAVLTLTLLVSSCGWQNAHKSLTRERAAHNQTIQTFTDAQAEANRKAEAKRKELETTANENAKQADTKYASLYDQYESNLLRFKASQSDLIRSYRSLIQATKSGHRPSGSADVLDGQTPELIITLADGRICAVNTARLQAVREWALGPPH